MYKQQMQTSNKHTKSGFWHQESVAAEQDHRYPVSIVSYGGRQ
jgi:hypothetical protein